MSGLLLHRLLKHLRKFILLGRDEKMNEMIRKCMFLDRYFFIHRFFRQINFRYTKHALHLTLKYRKIKRIYL